MLEDNGLKLHTIKSKSEEPKPLSINNIDDIKNYIKTDSLVVAYLDYRVLVGWYRNNTFEFVDNHSLDPNYIQRIRIFNKDEELLLWRSDSGFKGRYRKDEVGDEVAVVDAHQVLFGTVATNSGNFTKLTETRGTELILPFAGLTVDEKQSRVFIKTRNYIGPNEAYQATYVDCRFMGFTDKDKNYLK